MEFYWKLNGSVWSLVSRREDGWCITVEQLERGFWTIMVGGRPLQGRYSSEQGAKLDAWEWAKSKALVAFGARHIRLLKA